MLYTTFSHRLPPRAKISSQGMCPCIRVQLEAFANSNLFKTSLVARCPLGWSKTPSIFAERSIKHSAQLGALVTSGSQEAYATALVRNETIGVLLLNLGGPETLDDVQPFLFNLFADPVSIPRFGYSLDFAAKFVESDCCYSSFVYCFCILGSRILFDCRDCFAFFKSLWHNSYLLLDHQRAKKDMLQLVVVLLCVVLLMLRYNFIEVYGNFLPQFIVYNNILFVLKIGYVQGCDLISHECIKTPIHETGTFIFINRLLVIE